MSAFPLLVVWRRSAAGSCLFGSDAFWVCALSFTVAVSDGCVDCCIEGDDPLAADAVVSFGPTASPSTEMEGEFAVEIRMGDPPVAPERELA